MHLNLIDQLTLLAIDDHKGTLIPESTSYSFALAGAVILELALEKRISVSDGRVHVENSSKTGTPILDRFFEKIKASSKERSLKYWVEQIGNKGNSIKKETLTKLLESRILEEKEGKFLWIFKYRKYPVHNPTPENQLRKRLNDIVIHDHRPEMKEFMLLNLVESCGLAKEVFGKEQAKAFKKKMKTSSSYNHLSGEVNKSIREVSEAVNAMLVILITTVITTTTVTN
jgi:hypothetical protein